MAALANAFAIAVCRSEALAAAAACINRNTRNVALLHSIGPTYCGPAINGASITYAMQQWLQSQYAVLACALLLVALAMAFAMDCAVALAVAVA